MCCKVSNKERVFPHMKEESILVRHEDFPIKCTSRCLAWRLPDYLKQFCSRRLQGLQPTPACFFFSAKAKIWQPPHRFLVLRPLSLHVWNEKEHNYTDNFVVFCRRGRRRRHCTALYWGHRDQGRTFLGSQKTVRDWLSTFLYQNFQKMEKERRKKFVLNLNEKRGRKLYGRI